MAILVKDCLGFNLRLGTILIGILLTILSAFTTIYGGKFKNVEYPNGNDSKVIFYAATVWECLCLLSNIALLLAAFFKSARCLLIWIWWTVASLHVYCLTSVVAHLKAISSGHPIFSSFTIFMMVIRSSCLIYSIIVVNSYRVLQRERAE